MLARRTIHAIAAGALLAASLPALAGNDRAERDYPRRSEYSRAVDHAYPRAREVVVERRVERRVVARPVHAERSVYPVRPAPVYRPRAYEPNPVYHPSVREPAPVYYPHGHERSRGPNVIGTAAGAIVGAAIGSQVGHGPNRGATTALGAIIGGAIGSQF
jgi:hypothetical protein